MKSRFLKYNVVLLITSLAILTSAGPKTGHLATIEAISQTINDADPLPLQTNKAFKEGESISYRLHYGFLNAGAAVLEVKPDIVNINNRNLYHIVCNGYTIGSADWFFKVRDRYETYLDKNAMLPWMFVRNVNEGGFKFSQNYVFNHYTKKVDDGEGKQFDVPSGIQDMVSSFYVARNTDFKNAKEGDVYSFQCFMDKEIWPLKIRYVGKEIITTDIGKIHAIKFRPIVQKGRVFKKEEDMNVWISDDDNHIVLKVQANVLVGSIKMDIMSAKNLLNPTAIAN
ncbi:MAG: DUF3108 domain-containing protein [Bacteroidetes bacterium]|nr:DUF3108 domain-containing protein [Bacteroidota bacterium]